MALSAAAKYRQVANRLARIPSQLATEVAPALERRWRATYRAGQDPYGKAWAPLKPSTVERKGGDTRILRRTDETYRLTRVRPLPSAGVALVTGPVAVWHSEPTPHRVARPVVPLYGLPARWRQEIEAAKLRVARRAVRGG